MRGPLISIIIPVYNCGGYLRRAIDGALAQTHGNCEVIAVNDGSTDQSAAICDEYATADRRVHVVHKENGGEASARNAGLERAGGEFIMFCDADDEYRANAAEWLLEAMSGETDLAVGGYEEVTGGVSRYASTGESPYDRNALIDKLLTDAGGYGAGYIMSTLQAKLFKASIIREHRLRLNQAFAVGNDTVFVTEYLRHCRKIADTFYPMYIYNIYGADERVQGMAWHYPDEYRLVIEVSRRRIQILDEARYLAEDRRSAILGGLADSIVRGLVRAAAFELYFPEGLQTEIERAAQDEFVQECFKHYKPRLETDSVVIPEYIKKQDAGAAYAEIRRKSAEWENRETFTRARSRVRRIFNPERISPRE